jgi:hypothetical protein
MRTTIIVLILFVLIGCAPANPTATSAPVATATPRSGSGTLFSIDEVGLGTEGYITLTNFTDQPANLGGLFLCQGRTCFELPSVEVAPGSTARIARGSGTGLEAVVATEATIGELQPSDGEIALYASKELNNPKAILAYLEWGFSPHENTPVAIDAGLWIKGAFAPTSEKATRLYRTTGGLWLFDES